jgi:hypothetical protein
VLPELVAALATEEVSVTTATQRILDAHQSP